MFFPKKTKAFRPHLTSFCFWCAECNKRKAMYKLKDGPIDYFFCSDTHALEWLDYRHRNLEINKFLRLLPLEWMRAHAGSMMMPQRASMRARMGSGTERWSSIGGWSRDANFPP